MWITIHTNSKSRPRPFRRRPGLEALVLFGAIAMQAAIDMMVVNALF